MSARIAILHQWVEKMNEAESKQEVLWAMMDETGYSRGKCYRELAKVGYVSGRKLREDKGRTRANDEVIERVAALMEGSVKKNGVRGMGVRTARSIVECNGFDVGVSDSTLRKALKKRHLDGASLKRERAHTRLRSLHPNHVHEVDPSLCVLYYTPGGQQEVLHARELHRNKFESTVTRMRGSKLWRYVLTDHYSGSVVCKYYESAGENQQNLWDFLLYAWGKKDSWGYVMHGVPKVLLWDAGSANTSRAVQRALGMLEVESRTHMPGNPRAKGQVENANRLIETHFESRLHASPAKSVDELNESVAWFCAKWNNNTLPKFDSSLRRGDKVLVRSVLWSGIGGDELRLLPEMRVCRSLLTHESVRRKVGGDLTISYKHPRQKVRRVYDVRGVPGVYRDGYVEVMPLIMDEELVQVRVAQLDGSVVSAEVKPVVYDAAGFAHDAAVIGEEYKAVPDGDVEDARKRLEEVDVRGMRSRSIFAGDDGGRMVHAVGEEITVDGTYSAEEEKQSVVAVVRMFKERYPQWWHDAVYDVLSRKYPQGMSAEEVCEEEERIEALEVDYGAHMLKVV